MIYVDNLRKAKWPFGKSCHLFTDDSDNRELHKLAQAIGLKRRYFQDGRNFPHYDLTASKRVLATASGAVEVGNRFAVKVRKERG